MILYELTLHNEKHPVYKALEFTNTERHYSFVNSIIEASLAVNRPFLSQTILKAISHHAIACLHTNAGEYRPCEVQVGNHKPPAHYLVNDLMDDFVNTVNRWWDSNDAITLAAYVLWKLNFIHPFINGNGRTARAACYFVLCVKMDGRLGGRIILPELLRQNRSEYVNALRSVDKMAFDEKHTSDYLQPLETLITRLLAQQSQDIQY